MAAPKLPPALMNAMLGGAKRPAMRKPVALPPSAPMMPPPGAGGPPGMMPPPGAGGPPGMKRGGKVCGMKEGGSVKRDGIAERGKTRGKEY